jgi:hypothetical protein
MGWWPTGQDWGGRGRCRGGSTLAGRGRAGRMASLKESFGRRLERRHPPPPWRAWRWLLPRRGGGSVHRLRWRRLLLGSPVFSSSSSSPSRVATADEGKTPRVARVSRAQHRGFYRWRPGSIGARTPRIDQRGSVLARGLRGGHRVAARAGLGFGGVSAVKGGVERGAQVVALPYREARVAVTRRRGERGAASSERWCQQAEEERGIGKADEWDPLVSCQGDKAGGGGCDDGLVHELVQAVQVQAASRLSSTFGRSASWSGRWCWAVSGWIGAMGGEVGQLGRAGPTWSTWWCWVAAG